MTNIDAQRLHCALKSGPDHKHGGGVCRDHRKVVKSHDPVRGYTARKRKSFPRRESQHVRRELHGQARAYCGGTDERCGPTPRARASTETQIMN